MCREMMIEHNSARPAKLVPSMTRNNGGWYDYIAALWWLFGGYLWGKDKTHSFDRGVDYLGGHF